jgi:hypothetical protein
VSKIQNGQQVPTPDELRAWAEACSRPDAVPELLELLSQAAAVHYQWRHRLRAGGHAAIQQDLDAAVRGARRIRVVEVSVIPGLLQTPDYARRIIQMSVELHQTTADEIEPTVATRMRRQDALYDTSREFEFILTEAILRRPVGGREVMAAQLDRLLTLSGLSNIALAILPDQKDLPLVPGESFMILDDMALLETWVSEDTLRGNEAALYGRIADALIAEAVTGSEAQQVVARAAAALRDDDGGTSGRS